MKIVLCCGEANAGLQEVHQLLGEAGVANALPSRQRGMAPAEFLAEMFAAHELDRDGTTVSAQLAPGRLWHELAADMFVANLAVPAWGWADVRNLWTMEFWAEFDSQIRFVLAYTSPEQALGIALGQRPMSAPECATFLDSWTQQNDELLHFYHRHEARCVLVNSAAARCAPGRFLEIVGPKLGLALHAPADSAAGVGIGANALHATLARPLVSELGAAAELFRELESSADLDGAVLATDGMEALAAWQEYLRLNTQLGEAGRALDESRRQWSLQQSELDALRQQMEVTQAAAWAGEAEWRTRETLLVSRLTEQEAALLQSRTECAAANDGLAPLQAEMARLTEENELLLMQLHQMQDELAHYTAENQQLLDRLEQPMRRPAEVYSPLYQKTETFIDLTGEIDGENWYYAEHDGRWAGPERLSTLRIAPLKPGEYALTMDIVDAKAPDILNGMQVSINGMPLSLDFNGEGVVALVTARFLSEVVPPGNAWEFQLKFPRLISPAEHGSDDLRVLAVRMRSLKLRQIV